MICAYDKVYLNSAQKVMGAMFQYAVYDCKMRLSDFYESFLQSALSERFGKGDLFVIAGMSGAEIAIEVLHAGDDFVQPSYYSGKSQEYWTGWVLAYYQWLCGRSFREIDREIPVETIRSLYNPYHEMDITQVMDRLQQLRQGARLATYLKKIRQQSGLSQSDLALQTGIPLKTIQQYEQGRKDINKAQAEYIIKLSRALCCRPEDLLEM